MQAKDLSSLPAMHLFHAVTALNRNGQQFAARMIAAEALARTSPATIAPSSTDFST
jgi:hypothetical protein